jgi:predicted outer membrane repeat protein
LFQNNNVLSATAGYGGGLYTSSSLNLTGTQFFSNTAGSQGGGLYGSSVATLNGAELQGNTCAAASPSSMWR